jgi:hypothetical protein
MRRTFIKSAAAVATAVGVLAIGTVSASAVETPVPTDTPEVHPACWVTNAEAAAGKILKVGSCGEAVTTVKTELEAVGVRTDVDMYTKDVAKRVGRFQLKNQRAGLRITGKVDKKTWNLLAKQSKTSGISKQCLTKGITICANQKLRTIWFLKSGKVVRSFDARFGAPGDTHTRNGTKHVFCKHPVDRSEEFHVNMYNFMCIDGGQGIHGSVAIIDNPREAFAEPGSHGCIGVNMADSRWLYRHTPMGTKVVVYAG